MKANSSARSLRRVQWKLTLAWAVAWLACVAVFSSIAVNLDSELRRQDLDTDLLFYTSSVYELTWFDAQGVFHDDVFYAAAEQEEIEADLWIIEPGDPPIIHMQPKQPIFQLPSLFDVAEEVVAEEILKLSYGMLNSGEQAYRLRAIPTYQEGIPDRPKAAIIAIADPQPGQAAHGRFVRNISLLAIASGALGVAVGVALARFSLRPIAQSFEQRETFLAAAAHELRTPIAALRSVAETTEKQDAYVNLSKIQALAAQTSRVVDDLLMFARLDAGSLEINKESVRLDLLIETLLPDDDSVPWTGSPTEAQVDPKLISVALRNLLENARLHGRLPIDIRLDSHRVRIQDSGDGFPTTVLNQAEAAMAPTHSKQGAGIGLAICSRIAELHGGRLQLENLPSGGACATLYLN